MERRNKQESPAWDTLLRIALVLFGMAAGIAMCKFWPEFWYFLNWGISV